jgi:hypothetical protein
VAGQHQVEHEQRGFLRLRQRQPGVTIRGGQHPVAGLFQVALHHAANLAVIFDHKDGGGWFCHHAPIKPQQRHAHKDAAGHPPSRKRPGDAPLTELGPVTAWKVAHEFPERDSVCHTVVKQI